MFVTKDHVLTGQFPVSPPLSFWPTATNLFSFCPLFFWRIRKITTFGVLYCLMWKNATQQLLDILILGVFHLVAVISQRSCSAKGRRGCCGDRKVTRGRSHLWKMSPTYTDYISFLPQASSVSKSCKLLPLTGHWHAACTDLNIFQKLSSLIFLPHSLSTSSPPSHDNSGRPSHGYSEWNPPSQSQFPGSAEIFS